MSTGRARIILTGILLAWILVSLVAAPALAQDPSLEPPYRIVLKDGSVVTITARELSYFGEGWWYQLEDGQWVWESWFSLNGATLLVANPTATPALVVTVLARPRPTSTSAIAVVRQTLEAATATAAKLQPTTMVPNAQPIVSATMVVGTKEPENSAKDNRRLSSLQLLILLLLLAALFGFLLAHWWRSRSKVVGSQLTSSTPPSRRPPVRETSLDEQEGKVVGEDDEVSFQGHITAGGSLSIATKTERPAPVIGDPKEVSQPRRSVRPARSLKEEGNE